MKIHLTVNAFAKKESIEEKGFTDTGLKSYKVNLTVKPVNGKANQALKKLLSSYFKVSKSSIDIISGEKSKNKIVEIL